jgi:hypothetical protein
MRHIYLCFFLLTISVLAFSCTKTASGYEDSPTGAYKRLYDAVKSKNIDAIKAAMTKKSVEFASMAATRENKPVEQVLENGFTATTFSPTLPQMRDQRIDGDMGAVEVYNAKDKIWEDLPFIREDGQWKFAVGDMFAGTYKSPGKSQAEKERESANAVSNTMVPMNMNTNVNMNAIKPMVPKPATNMPRQPSNTPPLANKP